MGASATKGRPLGLLLAVAAATFGADQTAKVAVRSTLDPETPFNLIGAHVRLALVHNTGSAFGLITSGWVLMLVGGVVCVAIVVYVTAARGLERSPGHALPLGLVLGGSCGNLVDRIRTGGVTDFIDLRVWPVFNLADVAITVGIALLALGLMRGR